MALKTVAVSIAERAHRVTLENPGEAVPDGDGGFTQGWEQLATVFATVSPASAQDLERVIAGTVTAMMAPVLVVLPWIAGVTTKTRIQYHGATLAVIGFRDVDARQIRMEIVAEQRATGDDETVVVAWA
jgi:SPP1 family predicted phage head-tail adaptor